ncbi:MAG: hypothetical protein QNJ00_00390 [Woeseiaceae bacterium]|nr:hypothetical protein [Woeseiaceae bacterium]
MPALSSGGAVIAGCIATTLLSGCALFEQEQLEFDELPPKVQETKIYLQTVQPEKVFSLSYIEPLRYEVINVMYVLMESQGDRYLLELETICRPLRSPDIFADMADRRSIRGRIRAGIDTIRGCRIENIYKLPPLDETPGRDPGQITTPTEDGDSQEPQ